MGKPSAKYAAVKALERDGKVDPNDLIEAAKKENHPCHGDFTWDLEQAAWERWRDQAREIIRSFRFDVVVDDVTTPVVYYVPSPDEDDTRYISLPRIKGKGKTNEVILAEINMLVGLASRVYGIVLAKQNVVGAKVVAKVKLVRDNVVAIQEELGE